MYITYALPLQETATERALQHRNADKWGADVMTAGFLAVPTVLLECQRDLELDPLDLNVLMQIAKYWWTAENLPHPSKGKLADLIGVDARTIQRRISRLEKRGLVKRVYRRDGSGRNLTTRYDLSGLVAAARAVVPKARRARRDVLTQQTGDPAGSTD